MVSNQVRLRSHVICPCAFAQPLQKQNMDIASASQKTEQIKVVTGVREVVFANWREALHGSGIPRHVRTSYEYVRRSDAPTLQRSNGSSLWHVLCIPLTRTRASSG